MLTHGQHDDVVVDARTGPPVSERDGQWTKGTRPRCSRVVPASRFGMYSGMRSVPRRSLRSCRNWLRSSDYSRLVTQARRAWIGVRAPADGLHRHDGSLLRPVELFLGNSDRPARVARGRRPSTFIATTGSGRCGPRTQRTSRFRCGSRSTNHRRDSRHLQHGREHWNVLVRNLEVEERPRSGLPGVDVSDVDRDTLVTVIRAPSRRKLMRRLSAIGPPDTVIRTPLPLEPPGRSDVCVG